MNAALDAWNKADEATAFDAMIACCGATRWASAMVALRPIGSVAELSEAADRVWSTMNEADWMEAFACHPRIGERKPRTRQSRNRPHGQSRSSRLPQARRKMCWRRLPKETRATKNATASPILCAPPEKAPKRCSQSSSAASPATATPSCLRPPNSNARSRRFVWESGL